MQNILLTVSYDGTDFFGFQKQINKKTQTQRRTVQGEIEKALGIICKTNIKITGSGRTDSGVHAIGQKINFFSPIDSIPIDKYPVALNSLLPRDIRIKDAKVVSQDFSSRFSATARTYRYCIAPKNYCLRAYQSRFLWQIGFSPSIQNLNDMSSLLLGEKDFFAFSVAGDKSKSTFRDVIKARWFLRGGILIFEIKANAFLWKMVRLIVGTLLDLDKKHKGSQDLKAILQSKDRKKAGPVAPPAGLFLYNVCFYGKRWGKKTKPKETLFFSKTNKI